jgi:uncharacterized membrane protein
MPSLLGSAVGVAALLVLVALVLGLVNMMRDGSASRSQNLMRLRVGLQAVAILVICAALYFKGH